MASACFSLLTVTTLKIFYCLIVTVVFCSLSLHAAAVTHMRGFNLSLSMTLICEGNKFIDKYVTSTRVEYYNTIICSEERNVITGLRSLGF
jgi:hypothetical protein